MRRMTSQIIVFYVFLGAAVTLFASTGVFDAMGVPGTISAGDALTNAAGALEDLSASSGVTDTLIAVYSGVTSAFLGFALGVFAGPQLLINIGIPAEIVIFVHAPIGIFVGLDVAYLFSGREP